MVGVDYAARSEEIKLGFTKVWLKENPQNWIKYFFKLHSRPKNYIKILSYRVTHKGWDCKDDLNLLRYTILRLI